MKITIIREHCLVPAIALPLAPRINELYNPYSYVNKRTGKRIEGMKLSAEGRRYKKEIEPLINVVTRGSQELIKAIARSKARKLYMYSRCYYQEDRTDVDARVKSLQDAIASCLGIDDKRYIKHDVEKYVDKSHMPCIIVEVYEAAWIDEEQAA